MVPETNVFQLTLQVAPGTADGTNLATSVSIWALQDDPNPGNSANGVVVSVSNAPVAHDVSATVGYNSTGNPITLNITGGVPDSVAVASPPAHGTAIATGMSIAYTPSAGYSGPDSFTYTATNAGGTSGPATVTITVTPQSPSVQSVNVPGPAYYGSGAILNFVVHFDADVTVTGAPELLLTIGTDSRAAVYTSGSHTADLSFSYTVQPGDADFNGITVNTLSLAGGSMTGTASGTPVDLLLRNVGPTSGVIVHTATPTVTISTTAPPIVSGPFTLTVTFSEAVTGFTVGDVSVLNTTVSNLQTADNITYTLLLSPASPQVIDISIPAGVVQNIAGTPNAASNRLSITYAVAPLVSDSAVSVPAGTTTTITPSLSGPAATAVTVASGPSHGSVTEDGLSFLYTPQAGFVGTDSFSYTASNASGTSAPATVTITVVATAPVANPVNVTVPFGSVNYPIPLNITGDPPDGVAVPAGPSHGTVSISGTSITYTPAAGYSGPDSFTYTATNTGGTSAPATVTITVGAPAAPVANDVAASVAANSADNTIALNVTGGSPDSVAVASAPAHGTASVVGASITYTPAPGYSGPDSFTYTATNAGGTSAPATVTILVSAPTIALSPGALPDATAGIAYSQAITATGGTAPYAFALSSGVLPAGLSLDASGLLSGTPAVSGSFAFEVTATDALGASGTQAYVLAVAENIEAVRQRFDALGQSFVEGRMSLLASGIEPPGLNGRTGLSGRPGTVTANASENTQALAFATSLAEISAAGGAAALLAEDRADALPFNVWIDTRLTLHARTDDVDQWGEFALAAIGADYLVNDRFLAGVALYGDWMRDVSDDSEVEGSGFLAGPYVSIGLVEGVTLDASLFYGRSWNDASATMLGMDYSGRFETDRLLFRTKLEGTWNADALTIRPNATFFLMNEEAGAYTVNSAGGGPIDVPGFEKTDYRLGLGATFEYAYVLDNGVDLTPELGISIAGGNGGDGDFFSVGYGKLTAGVVLAGDAWRLGGRVELDAGTSGERSVSARGTFGVGF
ncbi:hypothetical protein VE25_12620 [Devosia geojensis]|uniref:Bacterial Ig-like domain-containing protein n=2 Tax=Devosia geojensis TaxID=443610 RepID=A0A0F5FRI2_9HYPH|nr:hypothetical protein VE25_12620 [Devosia geojensis]